MNNIKKYRKPIFFVIIFLFAFFIITALFLQKTQTPLDSSFVPILQVVGEPMKAVDTSIGKLLPVDEEQEKEYGIELAKHFADSGDTSSESYKYLNALMQELAKQKQKPFEYKIFILKENYPNAFALPGGVILVTEPLMKTLESEGELVSILAHEMGHIESGHCFNAVKFELLSKKINLPAAQLADFLTKLFFEHSFSKNQESDADAFAYKKILNSVYDPLAMARAFENLQNSSIELAFKKNSKQANLFRDYFSSHPPLAMRIEKYEQEALRWWKKNPQKKRYVGKKNLKDKKTIHQTDYREEWHSFTKNY